MIDHEDGGNNHPAFILRTIARLVVHLLTSLLRLGGYGLRLPGLC